LTVKELKDHGDYGIGTFDYLDDEMIQVRGKFYQIKIDGVAYPAHEDQKTPFAVVSFLIEMILYILIKKLTMIT